MPPFVNTNSHPIRVSGNRIRPGQVVEASGEYADALKSTNGVREANADDKRAYEQSQAQRTSDGDPSSVALGRVQGAREALRHATVSAPLAVVRGDDQAPFGPPTGTVSTKAIEAAKGPLERLAFGDHEALPGEHVSEDGTEPGLGGDPNGAVIHNAQVDAAESREVIAEELAATDPSADGDDDEDDGDGDGDGDGDKPEPKAKPKPKPSARS